MRAAAPDPSLSGWTDRLLLGVALGYAALVLLLTVLRAVPVTPDVLLVAAALAVVLVARGRVTRLREWVPFAVLFLAYELMRGLADDAGLPVHVGDVAALERSLFGGHLPTAVLQGALHPASGTDWLAVAGTVIYYFHFVLPVATALLLWRRRRDLFHPYLVALILLSFAGFVTYLLLPVAPPWLASQLGELGRAPGEPVVRDLKLHAFTVMVGSVGLDGEAWYDVAFLALSANPVAAFPSLHAAFAFLSFLVLRATFGAWGWLAFGYFAGVAFSIVYSGDHYVVDVAGGVTYASLAYGLTWFLAERRSRAPGAVSPPGNAQAGARALGADGGHAQQARQQAAEEVAGHPGEGAQQQDLQP
ncbi:MAG TPA: phosphatase PAP2 family protein [candidate division Zixibacteria bacterium]|nr:phosphatase PAP2 family protein [candidate division Zixibacteria bacterium]